MGLNQFLAKYKWTLALAGILTIAFLYRLYNLNYNSPFIDEAQYIILGRKVLEGHWQESNPFSWVGGMPLFYPPLSALFAIFGVVGSRFFNVVLGTVSVYLVFEFSRSLELFSSKKLDYRLGLIAAAFLAVLANPFYLSRIALYDMLSFSLLLFGLVVFVKGLMLKNPGLWQRENRLALAGMVFGLSFLAKYIVVILLPGITFVGLIFSFRHGRERIIEYLRYFVLPLGIIVGGYGIWQFDALVHFQTEQVSSTVDQSARIISNFTSYTAPLLLPSFFGALLLALNKKWTVAAALVLLASIAPLVHWGANNVASSMQHTFLTIVFLLPLAGYCLVALLREWRFVGSIILFGLIIGTAVYSYPQAKAAETAWSNTEDVMAYIATNTSNHERLLSAQDDITLIMLPHLADGNIVGIYSFSYKDAVGSEAYAQALRDGHFSYVLLNDHDHQEAETVARKELTSHYREVFSRQPFIVYQRAF